VSDAPSTADVLALLTERVTSVLGVDGPVTAQTRFDEDLHADSLDLVEVVESVERALRDQGYELSVDDDELLAVTTVGEAAERIAAGIAG
jgi:acyl carrier protein